ncbi:hypothetical protein EUGRSUZ_B01581 [Eucalyptus grandis]|uniref:Uncharacterized protein n=2 Tax=Eucalyptus grandis TaxID=71139 RepID=A0ACC3LQB4_EUCGR|nr:hypothetical protein EUGRSUZ_B01581 [Eucalyptus grandis]
MYKQIKINYQLSKLIPTYPTTLMKHKKSWSIQQLKPYYNIRHLKAREHLSCKCKRSRKVHTYLLYHTLNQKKKNATK